MDVVGSGADFSQSPAFTEAKARRVWFSPVYFRKESEPYMTLAMARDGRNAGVTVAEINLKLIWDVITALKIGQGGYAYVVDGRGRLIAHPDIGLVLRDTDLSKLPQVAAALNPQPGQATVSTADNLAGHAVLTAHALIPQIGWRVFVEAPLSEAFAPLYYAAIRTGLLLVFGLVAAALVALLLARRMTGPIRAIAEGAERIGAGDLGGRIDVHTGDELEGLAQQFNRMTADLQKSYAELEQRVADRTAELSEALDQQTATAEVLGIISSSPGQLQPVFEAIVGNAVGVCAGTWGVLVLRDGGGFRGVATHGVGPHFAETISRIHAPPEGTTLHRLLAEPRACQLLDVAAEPAYDPVRAVNPEYAQVRTHLCVPMLKENELLGAILIYRDRVLPFTDKQIDLVESFAKQAAIAMENARLISETREALEQQTATAEVLGVINSSPGDLAPVFDAMLEKAMRLCEAPFGVMLRFQGGKFTIAAARDLPPAFGHYLQTMDQPRGGEMLTQLQSGAPYVHTIDMKDDDAYRGGAPLRRAVVDLAGARTAVVVSLRKDGEFLGTFNLWRTEVRPFSDKQIALLQNFAAQAVIAMENARLITETREALEQQTATAEVLGVINSSPGDLAPVFASILEKAHLLCGAPQGGMFLREGDLFRAVATRGMPERFAQRLREGIGPDAPVPSPLVAGERFVHIQDMAEIDHPTARMAVEVGAARCLLAVPLRKDDALFGMIVAGRRELRPFTDKQISLLESFAAQAVIAIENARLITETREALEQQTATAEVLGVINSSPGDLAPVFDAMLERALRLCEAAFGHLDTYDRNPFHTAAIRAGPAAY